MKSPVSWLHDTFVPVLSGICRCTECVSDAKVMSDKAHNIQSDSRSGFGKHNLVCPLLSDVLTPAAAYSFCQELLVGGCLNHLNSLIQKRIINLNRLDWTGNWWNPGLSVWSTDKMVCSGHIHMNFSTFFNGNMCWNKRLLFVFNYILILGLFLYHNVGTI